MNPETVPIKLIKNQTIEGNSWLSEVEDDKIENVARMTEIVGFSCTRQILS